MAFTKERVIKIWNDKTGEHVDVGPDADGLDLVEIVSRDSTGTAEARLTMQREQALLVAAAIVELYGPVVE